MYNVRKSLADKADTLRELNPADVGKEIGSMKNLIHEIFLPILPYKAKNGVYFSSNGVSLCSNHGIVFGDNGRKGTDTYYLILRHRPTQGTGESKYETNTSISDFTTKALERLSYDIETKAKFAAENLLKGFK